MVLTDRGRDEVLAFNTRWQHGKCGICGRRAAWRRGALVAMCAGTGVEDKHPPAKVVAYRVPRFA